MKHRLLLLLFVVATFLCFGTLFVEGKRKKEKRRIVRIETSMGNIRVALSDDTPLHRDNFLRLAREGFYDGTLFHRCIKDFMIQGGDPEGTGMGGSDENIKGEFAANFVNNTISHKRGVISMARGGNDYNSASSQFFIMHKDASYLDAQYAGFGQVIEGLEIVDKIASVPTGRMGWYDDVPKTPVIIESIEIIE